jgi:O-antigen ligase
MGISTDKALKQELIFFTAVIMLVGLFTSRALLSTGLIIFLLLTCLHQNFPEQLGRFFTLPFLFGISLLFFIPAISWFWSEDKEEWLRWARVKLPLFLLPLAFAGNWQFSKKQWLWLAYVFLMLVFCGCVWSLWHYAIDYRNIHESYLRAKLMATPLRNDHVRFSLLVCIAFICSVSLISSPLRRSAKIILGAAAVFFAVYLHILSARTGLLGLYLFLFLLLFYLIFFLRKSRWIIALCIAVIAMPIAAWYAFPTFQNRIRYNLYDLSFIRKHAYLPGANDGNRLISLEAGWALIKEHPFGVGSGDVLNKTREWYGRQIPQMLETDKFYPSSEWLLYGAAAGWPGMLLFTAVMLLPFFEKIKRKRIFWISLVLVTESSFLFDIGLETQFGVFIYGFILLCWKRCNSREPRAMSLELCDSGS